MPKACPAEQRFWTKVEQGAPDECWVWTAGRNPRGYGRVNVRRNAMLAHRFAYELTHGEVPSHLSVRHTCDNLPV